MPQTLLATLALAIAGVFMLSQSETSTHNVQAVVNDEFELAATGALLQALEFADSRAFDEATTPSALRARLGLPFAMTSEQLELLSGDDVADVPATDLAPAPLGPASLPSQPVCSVLAPSTTPLCNDLSDLHGTGWLPIQVAAVPGVTLPMEVRFEVYYVDAERPDVRVNRPTFHKRVEAWVRSPDLRTGVDEQTINLHRVISYDPEVAAEYLRRNISSVGSACAVRHAELEVAAAAASVAAQTAQNAAATAAAAAATARQRATADATAAAQALQAAQAAQAATAAAQNTLATRQAEATAAQTRATTLRAQADAQWSYLLDLYYRVGLTQQVLQLYSQWQVADREASAASAAVAPAQAAVTAAQTAVTNAQAAHNTAQAAAAAAQATASVSAAAATSAEASAASAAQSAAAAQQSAQQAAQALAGFSCT